MVLTELELCAFESPSILFCLCSGVTTSLLVLLLLCFGFFFSVTGWCSLCSSDWSAWIRTFGPALGACLVSSFYSWTLEGVSLTGSPVFRVRFIFASLILVYFGRA